MCCLLYGSSNIVADSSRQCVDKCSIGWILSHLCNRPEVRSQIEKQMRGKKQEHLRIGIIGFGGAGMAHVGYFNRVPGCKVVSILDTKSVALERARQHRDNDGWLLTDDLAHFLDQDLDIVSVCSPDSTHKDYIVASLAAGKHVLCEKPLAASLEDCQQIIQASQCSQRVFAVLHQMRFVPLFQRIKEVVSSGELGNVFYLEGYYVHDLTRRASLYDNWRFEENATPLVYSGCHFVDLLRWITGEEAIEVTAFSNHLAFPAYPDADCTVLLMRFASGRIGKVVTAFGAGRPQDHSLRIYGDKATIENSYLMTRERGVVQVLHRPHVWQPERFQRKHSGKPLWRRLAAFTYLTSHNVGPYLAHLFSELVRRTAPANGEYALQGYPLRTYEHSLACIRTLADFVHAIRTGGSPQCDVIESAKTVATCLAGVEAYRTGKVVSVGDFWLTEF